MQAPASLRKGHHIDICEATGCQTYESTAQYRIGKNVFGPQDHLGVAKLRQEHLVIGEIDRDRGSAI